MCANKLLAYDTTVDAQPEITDKQTNITYHNYPCEDVKINNKDVY